MKKQIGNSVISSERCKEINKIEEIYNAYSILPEFSDSYCGRVLWYYQGPRKWHSKQIENLLYDPSNYSSFSMLMMTLSINEAFTLNEAKTLRKAVKKVLNLELVIEKFSDIPIKNIHIPCSLRSFCNNAKSIKFMECKKCSLPFQVGNILCTNNMDCAEKSKKELDYFIRYENNRDSRIPSRTIYIYNSECCPI